MEAGIWCGSGSLGLGVFYRARAAQECGGEEVV
jgi:hypothetical protein